MHSLTITDLARTEQLDRPTMAAVRGGWKMGLPAYPGGDLHYAPRADAPITAGQNLMQMQEVLTATASGAAFADCVGVDNKLAQRGDNTIVRR
jgi:hypothetical protein